MSLAGLWRHRRRRLSVQAEPVGQVPRPGATTDDCGLFDAVKGGWFQNQSNELFRGFPISAEDVVLDVGCGGGGAILFCARRGAHVIFTDSDAAKISALREKIAATPARQAEGVVSDSLPLPLGDGIANRIVALEMLEHVPQPEKIVAELFRVGRPGALYLLSVPAQQSELLQQGLAPDGHFRAPNHVNVFAPEAFAQLVTDSGLEIVSRHTYGFFWTLWMMFYWTSRNAEGLPLEGATHDQLAPPYPALADEWAALWHKAIRLPDGDLLRAKLDAALPKSQIILARKPEGPGGDVDQAH